MQAEYHEHCSAERTEQSVKQVEIHVRQPDADISNGRPPGYTLHCEALTLILTMTDPDL